MSRPTGSNTIDAIPEGPMPTNKAKWAAIAKWHHINEERKKKGFDEITVGQFIKHTGIKEVDTQNAGAHKEYIEAALSLAKGKSTIWFASEIEHLRESAERLRNAGEDKEYVKIMLEISSMLKFKDTDFSGMEDSEAKTATEVVEEIMTLMQDPAVVSAINNEDGFVAQKIIPAITNANFKSGTKSKAGSLTRFDKPIEDNGVQGPDKSVDSISQTEDRTSE